ncbi:MAG: hypothetical protein FWD24_01145 [Treponema sp.]|nr:hypothetical protein [Treponema sp.]
MLEKGSLVFVPNDDLNFYLRGRISDDTRLQLEKIAAFCYECEAIATFLFINKTINSEFSCSSYIPIYDNKDKLKKHIKNFKDFKQSIYITALTINNVEELKNKDFLTLIKRAATRIGYWNENYALLIINNKEQEKQVNEKRKSINEKIKKSKSANVTTEQPSDKKQIERLSLGLKGVLNIIPFGKIVINKFFILATVIASIVACIICFFASDKQIFYIEMVNDLIISIIPPLLGFSIAGFAIILNLSDKSDKIAKDNHDIIFKKNYAAFSVTILAQFFPLIVAVFIKLIKPISIEIPTSFIMASAGNFIVIFLEVLFFLFALFSIIDIIINVFNTGLIINFSFLKKKNEEGISND